MFQIDPPAEEAPSETEREETGSEKKEAVIDRESEPDEPEEAKTDENPEPDWRVSLLDQGKAALWGNYPVRADFFAYLVEEYGDEMRNSLEQAVLTEETDPVSWTALTGKSVHVLWCEYCRDREIYPEELSGVIWKECADPGEVVMDFAGDVNFMDGCANMNYMAACPGGITDCFSENLVEEMHAADLFMLNNEFAFSRRGTPLPGKAYTFRSDPDNAALLFDLGADIVGLANNHIYDYGEEALLDTLDTLDSVGMPHVGAGKDLSDAARPVYFIANGKKIAFTAATQIERSLGYTRAATEDSPGVLKTLDPTEYCEALRRAKERADFVVAFVHWGTEGSAHYEGDQVQLAEAFADAGADVIIGGHTHCLQGISYVSDVPVIYSIGNFWFSSTPTDGVRPRDSGIAQVRLQEDGSVVLRFLPCKQENHRTTLFSEGEERERILALEESLSEGITIDPDGVVKR